MDTLSIDINIYGNYRENPIQSIDNTESPESPDCIICLEPDNLLHSVIFTDKCKCEYKVHYKCMENWVSRKSICLICKKPLQLRINNLLYNIELRDGDILYNDSINNDELIRRRNNQAVSRIFFVIAFMIIISLLTAYLLD